MAFVKLGHAPRGSMGETYINPDHIAEVVITTTAGGDRVAIVKYIGGAVSQYAEGAVQDLIDTVLSPPVSQSRVTDGRIEEG